MRYPVLIVLHQEHSTPAESAMPSNNSATRWTCGGRASARRCPRLWPSIRPDHFRRHAEAGYYPVRPTPAGLAVIETWPECVYQWHREGFDLPYGSELLAEGDIFEVQAIRFQTAFALQFHPEVTHAMMHKWTTHGHERLAMPGAKAAAHAFRRPRGVRLFGAGLAQGFPAAVARQRGWRRSIIVGGRGLGRRQGMSV